MTKSSSTLSTILMVFTISAMIASGCSEQNANAHIDEGENDPTIAMPDTAIVQTESVAEQVDSIVEQVDSIEADCVVADTQVSLAEDTPAGYYENFVKPEVNKEEGYEVRRVNELAFVNSAATDTVLTALREMAPVNKKESITIYVYPFNEIHLEKSPTNGQRMVVEGEEDFEYHFGYVQIDTFFVDVKGWKGNYGEDVRKNAERVFKKTGRTNDYKYKYYSPCVGGGKLYVFEITDSTVTTLYKGISE